MLYSFATYLHDIGKAVTLQMRPPAIADFTILHAGISNLDERASHVADANQGRQLQLLPRITLQQYVRYLECAERIDRQSQA